MTISVTQLTFTKKFTDFERERQESDLFIVYTVIIWVKELGWKDTKTCEWKVPGSEPVSSSILPLSQRKGNIIGGSWFAFCWKK